MDQENRFHCLCCGRTFPQPGRYAEFRGEYFGFPVWERLLGCPFCGGAFEEQRKEAR